MNERQQIIRTEYARFQASLRLARWAAIDEALALEGCHELSSQERDVVDEAAAMGRLPFDASDDGEAHGAMCPAMADQPEDDIDDLLGGTCPRCE